MLRPDVQTAAVKDWLRGRLGRDVDDLQELRGGEWSQAFRFETGGRRLVLRLGRFADDYAKDAAARAFDGPGLPVPAIRERGAAFDGCYAISEWVAGEGFETLTTAGYEQVLPAVWRLLDALRARPLPPESGYGVWAPNGRAPYRSWRTFLLAVRRESSSPIAARSTGWRRRLASASGGQARFDAAYAALEDLAREAPAARHLIHADLMGDNLLVRDGRVAGVVDWGNAMYGDHLYDLARLTFWLPWFPELAAVGLTERAREHYRSLGMAPPEFESRLRCCQLHIGLDAQAYNAFSGRWEELRRSGERTLELARGG